jgi:peptidylprolyl isomerase
MPLTKNFAALILMATSAAASAPNPTGTEIIAQGGAVSLSRADIQMLIAALPATEHAAVASNLSALEDLVHSEVVRRAAVDDAKSKGFDRQPEILAQLDRVRNEALVRLWVVAQGEVPADYPNQDEIRTAYEANKQALATPTEYRLSQIFISAPDGADPAKLTVALKKADAIGVRIATADFSKLAQEQSEQPESARKGGDLGFMPENRLSPQLAAIVRNLKTGEVAGPVKTPQGLSFIKLVDKKVGAVPTLADAHDQLAAAMRARRATELEQAYLKEFNAKLGVTVNQIELAKLQSTLK